MPSLTTIAINTRGDYDFIDITAEVSQRLDGQAFQEGVVTVFITGSTAGLVLMEFEPGLIQDLKKALQRVAPVETYYAHNAKWGDGNGHSHVSASILGQSLAIPFSSGKLLLGTWQQIVLVDFDNRPRQRQIYVKIIQG
ncbi:MAG: YjbQ family protein [Dehalococcoidaceae bacterium]|nr:YjbQ family protein [Dehalococcoidaceae bacterium]